MPFIGRDWRSPGEAWVKTESLGWQRAKIIESSIIHPTACHSRSCNEYLDTSSCISPKSWPPKTEIGKHMPRDSSQQKSKNIKRKIRQSWLKVVNDEKINSIDTHAVGMITDSNNCCCQNLEDPLSTNCMLRKSETPDRPCSSVDFNMSYNDLQQPHRNRSLSPQCPRSESAVSSSSLLENYNNEQELLTSTPTAHYRTPSPDTSVDSSSSCKSEQTCQYSQQQQQQCLKNTTPLSVNVNERVVLSSNERTNDNNLSANYDQTAGSIPHQMNIKNEFSIVQQGNKGLTCCHNHPQSSSPLAAHPITVKQAPHCQITLKPTREVATYNTISEAFYRLDFCNAIHDIRRFNYVCKLLHLLITQNLTSLSGCATRILFTMLEQVAWQVASNKQNIHILYNLLDDLKKMIQKYYCWGRPIGSSLLWQQHFSTIERISHLADQIDIAPPPNNDNSQKTMNDLPTEMIREIMLRLNDYRDIVNSAEAFSVMQSILNGQHIWRQLCKYHFTKQQLRLAIENHYDLSQSSWSSSNVKFAKFVSADGRSICRRPINSYEKRKHTKQQLSDCCNNYAQLPKNKDSSTAMADNKSTVLNHEKLKSSENMNSIKDKTSENRKRLIKTVEMGKRLSVEQSSDFNLCGKSKNSMDNSQFNKNLDSNHDNQQESFVNDNKNRLKDKTNLHNDRRNAIGINNETNSNTSQNKRQEELDWEQVFHQLRKKFGLKEEYADCLVLCRHCRCLFWKSFGHPCIKNDSVSENKSDCSSTNCDQLRGQPVEEENINNQPNRSVAVLSQSYLQIVNNQSRLDNNRGTGNGNQSLQQQQQQKPAESRSSHQMRQRLSANSNNDAQSSSMSRSMLEMARSNLVQQPRSSIQNENINLNRQLNNVNNSGENSGNRPSQNSSQMSTYNSHIAISPQAFLKFFSL